MDDFNLLKMTLSFLVAIFGSLCSGVSSDEGSWSDEEIQFAVSVHPLLVEKCFPCHGADSNKIKGELNLTSRNGWLSGGGSGKPAVISGDAGASVAFFAVQRVDPDLAMPPKENDRLNASEVRSLKEWIDSGLVWVDEADRLAIQKTHSSGEVVLTSGGLSEDWSRRSYDPEKLWAWRPHGHPIPPADPFDISCHPVDRFIHQAIEEKGLKPVPRSSRAHWIRRVTFDLIGLPPTNEEVEDFVSDPDLDPISFERVVDRLLASSHFGEHWARHWLDVTRYADSSGLANDYARGAAWRYRDYVVRAFNEDLPFEEFVTEQLAGDELHDVATADNESTKDPEWLMASGFLRMGPWELTGMEVAKVARQKFLDDATDIVGQTFLAQPLQCARCHDHKFDPIPTRDYYRFQSVFSTTQIADREAPYLKKENLEGFEEEQVLRERLKRFEKILADLKTKEIEAGKLWAQERSLSYISRAEGIRQGIDDSKLPPKNVGFEPKDYGMERIARKGMERLRWELDRYQPYAMSTYTGATPSRNSIYTPVRLPNDRSKGEWEETAILTGGDPFSPSAKTNPGGLSALENFNPDLKSISFPMTPEGRRLALAKWITHPQNPMTSRVFVNRVWGWLMGQGIVKSANNFGSTGSLPTHPELLDWLAQDWISSGRKPKSLIRKIVTSETYRRASLDVKSSDSDSVEAGSGLWATFPSRRLSSDELRDAMLAVSGDLNFEIGGIPIRPEINMEIAMQPRMVMGTFAAAWQPNPEPARRHRRSLYAMKLRGLSEPFQESFNSPNSELSCERREDQVTASQVFSLMNSRFTYQRAVGLALRVIKEAGLNEEKLGDLDVEEKHEIVQRAGHIAYGRRLEMWESQALLDHWDAMTAIHTENDFPKFKYPLEVTREAAEENTGEKFSFTEPLEFYREFQPDPDMADVAVGVRGLAEVGLVLMNSNEFLFLD